MTDHKNVDHVFLSIDRAITALEDEGSPCECICEVLTDSLELADEYLR